MRSKIAIGSVLAFVLVAGLALAAKPRNGGFESGDFTGWKVTDPGGGNWFVYEGTDITGGAPLRGLGPGGDFYEPPRGRYAAAAYQGGPGLNILHRRLRLKADAVNKLGFFLGYKNSQERFYTPDNFDYNGGMAPPRGGGGAEPNQQFRIDLLKAKAPVDTLKDKHILATLYRTRNNDQRRSPYKKLSFNLTEMGLRGRIQFRVAEVDNQGPLSVGIDNVRLKSRPAG